MYGMWWIFIGIILIGIIIFGITVIVNRIKYGEFDTDDWFGGLSSLVVCSIVALCIFLPLSILCPLDAKKEVLKYKKNYEMIQSVMENGTEYDNIAISQTLIEYNTWLSEAKADKEFWGNWSVYVYEDLDSLEYIVKLTPKGE